MSAIETKVVVTGLLFLGVFGSGIWLSNAGRPANAALLAVHKLVSLAAAVLIVITVRQLHGQADMSRIEIGAVVVTALLFVLTGATGVLSSGGNPVQAAVLAAHRVAPLLTVLSTAATMYLLSRGRL